jgi:hypothetical protein
LRAFCHLGSPGIAEPTNDTVRVGDRPSYEYCGQDQDYLKLKDPFEQLVYMLDAYDGHRARKRRRNRSMAASSLLVGAPPPVNVPTHRPYRRSWLFGASDIPQLLLETMSPQEISAHVEAVRYTLMQSALEEMRRTEELWLYCDQCLWQVPVHVMDAFRKNPHRPNRVKYDSRTFHGHPNRERNAGLPVTST